MLIETLLHEKMYPVSAWERCTLIHRGPTMWCQSGRNCDVIFEPMTILCHIANLTRPMSWHRRCGKENITF